MCSEKQALVSDCLIISRTCREKRLVTLPYRHVPLERHIHFPVLDIGLTDPGLTDPGLTDPGFVPTDPGLTGQLVQV